MLGLPPHSTHWTQPLDVKLMKPLKTYWTTLLDTQRVATWLDSIFVKEQHIIEALAEPCDALGQKEPAVSWSVWDKCFRPSNIKSAFYDTGLWPIDWDKVKDVITEAARRAQEEKVLGKRGRDYDAPSNNGPSQAAGNIDSPEMPKVAEELRLEAKYLEALREAEQIKRRLAQIESFKKRKAASDLREEETWEPSVQTLCDNLTYNHSEQVTMKVRARKRTRRTARGSQAVVLNSDEMLAAHEAALEHKEKSKEIKAQIKEAKKAVTAASSGVTAAFNPVKTTSAAAEKASQYAAQYARDASDAAKICDKTKAKQKMTQAQKQAAAAAAKAEATKAGFEAVKTAAHLAFEKKAAQVALEMELQRLIEAASIAPEQEDSEEEEEEVEEVPAGGWGSRQPDPGLRLEAAKHMVQKAQTMADEAAVSADYALVSGIVAEAFAAAAKASR